MGNESLSKQSLEKLKSMPRDMKIKLFHRLRIVELNKIIRTILSNAVGETDIKKTKAKIIHQLYDENYKQDAKYKELQSILDSGKNFYDQLDSYTTSAYANYYLAFTKFADGARDPKGIDSAMVNAFKEVMSSVRTSELKIDSNNHTAIPSALLESKYRKEVVAYLEKELSLVFNVSYKPLRGKEYVEQEDARRFRSLISRRNVEKYSDGNGGFYFLDADGELFTEDEITDV